MLPMAMKMIEKAQQFVDAPPFVPELYSAANSHKQVRLLLHL